MLSGRAGLAVRATMVVDVRVEAIAAWPSPAAATQARAAAAGTPGRAAAVWDRAAATARHAAAVITAATASPPGEVRRRARPRKPRIRPANAPSPVVRVKIAPSSA